MGGKQETKETWEVEQVQQRWWNIPSFIARKLFNPSLLCCGLCLNPQKTYSKLGKLQDGRKTRNKGKGFGRRLIFVHYVCLEGE